VKTSYWVARAELPLLTATTPATLAVIIDIWNTVRVLLGTRRLALPLDRSFHVYIFQRLDWDFQPPNFETTPDSPPRKVMLSESERHMILLAETAKASQVSTTARQRKSIFLGLRAGIWKNVAMEFETDSSATTGNVGRHLVVQRVHSERSDRTVVGRSGPISMRSKTNPERLGTTPFAQRRVEQSFDQSNQLFGPPGWHFSQQDG